MVEREPTTLNYATPEPRQSQRWKIGLAVMLLAIVAALLAGFFVVA